MFHSAMLRFLQSPEKPVGRQRQQLLKRTRLLKLNANGWISFMPNLPEDFK